jgi:5-formyltetrahydrofolate cyclo-ligase
MGEMKNSEAQSEAKASLRRQVQAELTKLSTEERSVASAKARELLLGQTSWQEAKAVLFYAPVPLELDLWPLLNEALDAGKSAALPRYAPQTRSYIACRVEDLGRDLVEGHFGIREPNERCSPMAMDMLDLVLVPGIAFDLEGHRLGRGMGFYDRLLAEVGGRRCGVAFEQQIVDRVPVEAHDLRVQSILTPRRWVEV